ncbi:Transcriptional regulatory protein, C terminal [Asanoa hainanensis]|uniref:Transcriptional regulatory protein, C terminal n=1 Tax=Asanoa hainanensis TaxID=560556 RepID=A0A239N3Y1_9ACTN|nr:BTAD domain-containing putative transcriptional regulator [Asanoa hainanensis]SNT48889.1 Transcriptional regulatory protein, C terminal [Asanoa hainanensis]
MATSHALRVQILGPLRLWRDGVEQDVGPRQQAYLLALLLAMEGHPISTAELVDLIWEHDPPNSATSVIQKYVSVLRRMFEPALPARLAGSFLHRRGDGYLFVAGDGMLDLVTFRQLVDAARTADGEGRHAAALDHYVEALGLWHGSAGEGLTHGPTAIPVFAGLDDEFFAACVAAAELAVSTGQPERALPALHRAATMSPLHEPVQASLIVSLGAAGQQAEALSVFRTVRARLADELGIDPGPALRTAHQRVLRQDDTPAIEEADGGVVGRFDELAALRQAVQVGFAGGTGLAIVEGAPGVGKTRLLEEATADAGRHGALVAWGRCLEGDGTPSLWPWEQVLGTVLDALPQAAHQQWLAGDLGRLLRARGGAVSRPEPDRGAQFRLFEQVTAAVGQVAARRTLVLVIDDLQWADVASLRLFAHLAARLPAHTVLIGALRDRAPVHGAEVGAMLAASSRLPGHRRLWLGPLDQVEVAELVRGETGQEPSPGAAAGIHTRTAGNPFFVRELSRLLADSGDLTEEAVARAGVPASVRDVVRARMTGLDEGATGLLQLAAVIGRTVDLGVLASAADLAGQTCLDRLEPLDGAGLLEPAPGDPRSFRFPHDLVRDTVRATTPPRQATRLHVRVADALDRNDAEALAYHLWEAGPLVDPARTASALIRAGEAATAKLAFEAAERHLRTAVDVARTAGLAELELAALSQLATAVWMRVGPVGSAPEVLQRAADLARSLGRERDAADFLFSRCVGASHGLDVEYSGLLARRLLDEGEASTDPVVRAYGLIAWGIHQWDIGAIGEAFRCLRRYDRAVFDRDRQQLRQLGHAMQAVTTAMHGDLDAARAQFDVLVAEAGDDPYSVAAAAHFSAMAAATAGDPGWLLRVTPRGLSMTSESRMVHFHTYLRLGRYWAQAMTGGDARGGLATEAERLLDAMLLDPPRSGLALHTALIGEMHLVEGRPTQAQATLDRADSLIDKYGQRSAKGLVLLLRARLAHAQGKPMRSAAERAHALSTAQEAHLFAHRARDLLAINQR